MRGFFVCGRSLAFRSGRHRPLRRRRHSNPFANNASGGGTVQALAPAGAIVIQCTSPFVARRSFWCVDETLHAVGWSTEPYHLYVPSFGEWGFILAYNRAPDAPASLPSGLKYLTPDQLPSLFEFPPDMNRVPTEPNRLNNQVLVRYFEQEWRKVIR